jgi:hypothetical protein
MGQSGLSALDCWHRADALRILDFPHAAQYVSEMGELASMMGAVLPPVWLTTQLHTLKTEGADAVLPVLERLCTQFPAPEMQEKLSYLRKRADQMQYPTYQAAGWPIGSGMAESGNKLVVQVRLKGAGMHWERENVNPMLALRTTLCSDRWTQDWQVVRASWHTHRVQRFRTRSQLSLDKASLRLQQTFLRFPLPVVLACFPSPAPAPAPAALKGRTEGQKRWGRQTFSQRAIQDGRYAKK